MGLLDDAIREHLELKRRRGADPGEVAREQREALDPVPRDEAEEAADTARPSLRRTRQGTPPSLRLELRRWLLCRWRAISRRLRSRAAPR